VDSPKNKNLIKTLYASVPKGGPVDTETLKGLGISASLASHYVSSGWLMRLGRGAFMFPGDELKVEACVSFLSRRIPGLHVGGKTALAWRGVRHNVGPRERLCLWGDGPGLLPEWFTARYPATYVSRRLFTPKLDDGFGVQSLPETPEGPGVSVPERALLELLSDVGVGQGIEEARNLMEGLRAIRLDVLGPLLKNCTRVKVLRLCRQWAEELNLGWAGEVRKISGPQGKGRWVNRLSDGTTLILKP
jgi:hypothetical protein